ncbi:MAG: single-stranded DNA-binding protein [Candidatus Limnocylindrales bacterium]
MSLCKMLLIGNLGRDPEMRYTPSGRPVTQFTLAVNRNTKNQAGEWQEQTEWFRVTAWGQLAERTAEQLRKGSKVFVEGRFQSREWEAQDGQKRTALEVTADAVLSLDRRQREEDGGEAGSTPRPTTTARPAAAGPAPDESSDMDDLPF